jgi:hypothetical protein
LTWPGIASRQNYQNHENQIRKIMIIKAANQRKLQGCKLYDFGELFEKHPTRKIIDFDRVAEHCQSLTLMMSKIA